MSSGLNVLFIVIDICIYMNNIMNPVLLHFFTCTRFSDLYVLNIYGHMKLLPKMKMQILKSSDIGELIN